MSNGEHPKPFELPPRVIGGYCAALAASSGTFVTLPMMWAFASTLKTLVHQPALLPAFFGGLLFAPIMLAYVLFFAFLFTIIPSCVWILIYTYFKISNVLYFVLVGALTGCLITALLACGSFMRQAGTPGPGHLAYLSSCGAVGGLTYWWVAVRNRGRTHQLLAESP